MQIKYQTHKVTNSVIHSFCHEKDYCESFIKTFKTKPIKGYTYKIYCCNNTYCNTKKDLDWYGVSKEISFVNLILAFTPVALSILLFIFLFAIFTYKKRKENRDNPENQNFL